MPARRCWLPCTGCSSQSPSTDEKEPITADDSACSESSADIPRTNRQSLSEKLIERCKLRADPRAVGNRDDQPDGNLGTLSKRLALELARAQLRLQVHEGPFDLNLNRFIAACEQDVRGTTVALRDRRFEARRPGGVQAGEDCLRNPELTGIAKSDAIDGVELLTQLVASCGGHAAASQERYPHIAAFSLTDDLLADARPQSELPLRQAR